MRTFFQICTTFTIIMFMFTLAVSWVSGLGIYGDADIDGGISVGNNASDSVKNATISPDYKSGFTLDIMWALVLTGAGITGILVAWLTHSTAIIGVFLFSAAFWASYVNCIGIVNIGGWIDPSFLLIATGGMGLIWIGGVAGMLSGSG